MAALDRRVLAKAIKSEVSIEYSDITYCAVSCRLSACDSQAVRIEIFYKISIRRPSKCLSLATPHQIFVISAAGNRVVTFRLRTCFGVMSRPMGGQSSAMPYPNLRLARALALLAFGCADALRKIQLARTQPTAISVHPIGMRAPERRRPRQLSRPSNAPSTPPQKLKAPLYREGRAAPKHPSGIHHKSTVSRTHGRWELIKGEKR